MTALTHGGYLDDIVASCGCAPQEAAAVEELMRLGTHNGCLDHLSGAAFRANAEISYLALQELLAEADPYWTSKVKL